MKKYARILVAVPFLLGLSVVAKAESSDAIVVALPFEFVVAGKTLPAGTYTMSRVSDGSSGPLMITDHNNGKGLYVLPYVSEHAFTDKPTVDFQLGGEKHFLSTIHTTWGTYQIPVSQSALAEAAAASHDSGSPSANSGNE
jgi:hypothetical protein